MANNSPFSLISSFLDSNCSKEEKYLASLIYFKTSDLVEDRKKSTAFWEEDDDKLAEKIEITRENFGKIIRMLKEASNTKREFRKRFREWGPQRKDNIEKLRKLAKAINKNRRNCNISKITSSTVGVLGGLTICAAFAFPPLGVPLLIGGGVSSVLGGATVFGTSVTEVVLLKNRMKNAKQVLEKDIESFKLMSFWFKHSQDFIDAVEKVVEFSVAKEIFNHVKQCLEDVAKISYLKNNTINPSLQKCIEYALEHILLGTVSSSALALAPAIVTFIFVVIVLRKNNSIMFESIVFSHHTVLGLTKMLNFGGDLGMLVVNAYAGATAAQGVVAKVGIRAIAHTVFASFGILLDVVNLILTSIDIHKGSANEYAALLDDASDKLEDQYEMLFEIYDELDCHCQL